MLKNQRRSLKNPFLIILIALTFAIFSYPLSSAFQRKTDGNNDGILDENYACPFESATGLYTYGYDCIDTIQESLFGIIDHLSELSWRVSYNGSNNYVTHNRPGYSLMEQQIIWGATKHIENSLDPIFWESCSSLTNNCMNVFDEEKKAVKELMKVDYPVILEVIESLTDISKYLAQMAIDDVIVTNGDREEINEAQEEMTKAQEEYDKGKYDRTIDHYKKAWDHAKKAMENPPGTPDSSINDSSGLPDSSINDSSGLPDSSINDSSGLNEQIEYEYITEKVGETERAPHAMFGHNGELIISTISRNGISHSPIYSYSNDNGLQRRSQLPDANESGNYGFSFGDGLHIVAEAWEGMIDYVAQSPDGPWTKHDYTHLNPHSYKNLKWGFGYRDPATGQQFMGFGNDEAPGVVITSEAGEWKLLSAPKDMLFPTSMGVIPDGPNAGTHLICSSTYDKTRLYAVDANGQTEKLIDFNGWSYMVADHNNRIAYVATEKGKVFWSSFDDLKNWQEAQYQDAQGNSLDKLGRAGEMNVHPQTGQVILPVADSGDIGHQRKPVTAMGTNFYEAVPKGDTVVFRQVGRIDGAGLWELRSAVVGNELYYGSGLVSEKKPDATPGGIYKISASSEA